MKLEDLKSFLDQKVNQYHVPEFIPHDPIQIPHLFNDKEDIEIAGFLVATIAWGNRKSILNNAHKLMELMDQAPADFIRNHEESDLDRFNGFVHRTFNSLDCKFFIKSLQNIYLNEGGLESVFYNSSLHSTHLQEGITRFREVFFSIPHEKRTMKHVSNPMNGSSAKRLNMFLRWMVRDASKGVDFGIWKKIKPNELSIPLDVHTGNVSRQLGMLKRKQNDAKAVLELDKFLRKLDPVDPVKYDFALFGLGVNGDI
jgi:uncharacterized protein (TIGR02757 family)